MAFFCLGPMTSSPSIAFENPNICPVQLVLCKLFQLNILPQMDKKPKLLKIKSSLFLVVSRKAYFVPFKTSNVCFIPTIRIWGRDGKACWKPNRDIDKEHDTCETLKLCMGHGMRGWFGYDKAWVGYQVSRAQSLHCSVLSFICNMGISRLSLDVDNSVW